MNKKIFVPALLAAVLASSIPALAQERGYHNDANNAYQQRDDRNQARDDRQGDGREGSRYDRNDRNDSDRDGYRYGRDHRRDGHRDGRSQEGGWGRTADFNSGYDGWGPDHDMHRGDRLPSRYRNHQYVVDNWRAHHLSAPPRGHHWVQAGADYLLVAAATGLIVSAVTGH
ncbi:MAG: RcnB family protein [Telluria sp.]